MRKGSFEEFFVDSEIARNYEERKERIEKGGLIMQIYDENYFVGDKPQWVKDFFRKVDIFCLNEVKTGVRREILKTYVRYSYKGKMFLKIKAKLESLKVYPKLKYHELEQPPRWVRDYAKISRQTWCEAVITREDLIEETIILDILFELIKKSFDRVIKSPKLSKKQTKKPVVGFLNSTKAKINIEVSTDGFCQVGIRVHKSQLTKILEKIIE